MGVNMFDRPVKANFIDTYAAAPYREVAAMGQQLEATKNQAEAMNDANLASLQMDALDYGDLEDQKRKQAILGEYEDRMGKMPDMYYEDPEKAKAMARQMGLDIKKDKTRGEWSVIQGRHDAAKKKEAELRKKYVEEFDRQDIYNKKVKDFYDQIGQAEYDAQTGTGEGVGSIRDTKYISQEDTDKTIREAVKVMKADEFLKKGFPKEVYKKSFKQILEMPGSYEMIKEGALQDFLASQVTGSMMDSAELRGNVERGRAGEGNMVRNKLDKDGNVVMKDGKPVREWNTDSPLVKSMLGIAGAGSYYKGKRGSEKVIADSYNEKLAIDRTTEAANLVVAPSVSYGETIDYTSLDKNIKTARNDLNTLNKDFTSVVSKSIAGYDNMNASEQKSAVKKLASTDVRFRDLHEKIKAKEISVQNQEVLVEEGRRKAMPSAKAKFGDKLEKIFENTTSANFVDNMADYGLKGSEEDRTKYAKDISRIIREGVLAGKGNREIEDSIYSRYKGNMKGAKSGSPGSIHMELAMQDANRSLRAEVSNYVSKHPSAVSRRPNAIMSSATGKYSNSIGAAQKILSEKWGAVGWSDSVMGGTMSSEAIEKQGLVAGADLSKEPTVSFSDDIGPQGYPTELITFYNSKDEPVKTVHVTRGDKSWDSYNQTADSLIASGRSGDMETGRLMKAKARQVGNVRLGHAIQGVDLNSLYNNDETSSDYGKPVTSKGKTIKGITYQGGPIKVVALDSYTSGQATKSWQILDHQGQPIIKDGAPMIVGGEKQLILKIDSLWKK